MLQYRSWELGAVSPAVPYHWYITRLRRSSWPRPPYFSICYINIVFGTWANIYYSEKISNLQLHLFRYTPLLAIPTQSLSWDKCHKLTINKYRKKWSEANAGNMKEQAWCFSMMMMSWLFNFIWELS